MFNYILITLFFFKYCCTLFDNCFFYLQTKTSYEKRQVLLV